MKDVASLIDDVLPEHMAPDYEFRYVDIGSVSSDGRIIDADLVTFHEAPSRARRRVTANDTIISTVRTYLKAVALIEEPSSDLIVSTGFAVLRPKPVIDAKFLWRVLHSEAFIANVISHSEGVGYPAIVPSVLMSLPIWFPPSRPEQRKIITSLARVESTVQNLIAQQCRLRELITERDRAITTNALAIASVGAVDTRLGQITALIQTGPFGSQLHFDDYVHDGVPLINPVNLIDGGVVAEGAARVAEQDARRLTRYRVRPGDVILARRGEMGRVGLVGQESSGWLCGTGALIIRPIPSRVRSEYLAEILASEPTRTWLQLEARGTTIDNLNVTVVSRVPVKVPTLSIQERVLERIGAERGAMTSLLRRCDAAIDLMREYLASLISAATTGRLGTATKVA